jgi:hypothetical protein
MAFTPPGSPVTTRISFNSGTIDFGNSRLVDIDNIALSIEWSIADLYVVGSIKPQFKAKHSQKVTLEAKLKSYAPELEMLTLGSSSIGSPTSQILTLDGQPTLQNPVITLFDSNGKEIQYQLTGAVFKSTKLTAKMEDYSEFDVSLESLDISEIYTV